MRERLAVSCHSVAVGAHSVTYERQRSPWTRPKMSMYVSRGGREDVRVDLNFMYI